MIAVTVFGDTTIEPDETLHVLLSAPSNGYDLGRASAIGTILNDDGITTATTVGIGDAMVVRSRTGNQALQFPVTLSQPMPSSVIVAWSATDGSAHFGPSMSTSDYGGYRNGTITFAAHRDPTHHHDLANPARREPERSPKDLHRHDHRNTDGYCDTSYRDGDDRASPDWAEPARPCAKRSRASRHLVHCG